MADAGVFQHVSLADVAVNHLDPAGAEFPDHLGIEIDHLEPRQQRGAVAGDLLKQRAGGLKKA